MTGPLEVRKAVESTVAPLGGQARDATLRRIQASIAAPGPVVPQRGPRLRLSGTAAVPVAVVVSAAIVAAALAVMMAHTRRQPGARGPVAPGQPRVAPPPVRALRPAGPPASLSPPRVAAVPPVKASGPPPSLARPASLHPVRELTAEALYLQAEAALRADHRARAGALLRRVIERDPTGRLADAARYDLALLAVRAGRAHRALELLDQIAAHAGEGPLDRAARALRCRVAREHRLPCGPRAP